MVKINNIMRDYEDKIIMARKLYIFNNELFVSYNEALQFIGWATATMEIMPIMIDDTAILRANNSIEKLVEIWRKEKCKVR